MLTKEKVREHIKSLSEEFTIDELIGHLMLLNKVENGLTESARGEGITHQAMENEIEKWGK